MHPDLFTHYPREKEVNQEAFSRFQASKLASNGLLDVEV